MSDIQSVDINGIVGDKANAKNLQVWGWGLI